MSNQTRPQKYSEGFPEAISAFNTLTDPRTGNAKFHYFGEILFIAIAALITQCEGFEDMERFAKNKEGWLRKFLLLPHGLPSDDTFRRIFTAIEPKQFNKCFITFARELTGEIPSQLIAVDGKTARHSFDEEESKKSIHLISAWATETGISLGQLEVGEKTNEIPEVPKLLEMLDLKGHTVSLDAMGCQKSIAQKITSAEADYILALKGNHGNLHKKVVRFFDDYKSWKTFQENGFSFSSYVETDGGHGRIEKRTVLVTNAIDWIDPNERKDWEGFNSLICVESERSIGQKRSVSKRYYLTSHAPEAELLSKMIRAHWSIENQCHWVLDVTWNEDQSRIRKGNASQNVALLRKMALNLLKLDNSIKDSIRGKRLQATLNDKILESLITQAILK